MEGVASVKRDCCNVGLKQSYQDTQPPRRGHSSDQPPRSTRTERLLESTLTALQDFVEKLGDAGGKTGSRGAKDACLRVASRRSRASGGSLHRRGERSGAETDSPSFSWKWDAAVEEHDLAKARKKLHRERKKFMERHRCGACECSSAFG